MSWEAEVKELGEVCSFQRGLTYAKGDEVDLSENVVLRANNISLATNALDFAELRYIKDSIAIPQSKLIRRDTLMICTASGSKSHLGKVAYVDDDYGYAFGGFMGLLVPEREVHGRYLYYSMLSDGYKEFIDGLSDGVNINNLKWDDLKSFTLPVPLLPEQQRIAARLDAVFATLTEAQSHVERNRANARELFESYLNGVHAKHEKGWEQTTLGAEVEVLVGFAFKSKQYTENKTDVKLLRGDNIVQGSLRWDDVKRWSSTDTAEYARYQMMEGDVVLAMDRTWVKAGLKYASLSAEDLPCLLVQRTACLRCGPNLDKEFLRFLIGSKDFTNYVISVQTGIGVPHISGGQISAFKFFLPSLDVQRQVAKILAELEVQTKQLETTYQQKLAELAGLKKAVLGAAFRGEL